MINSTPQQKPSLSIRRFRSHQEAEDEDCLYWLAKSIPEKMAETDSLIRYNYRLLGVDIDVQRPERTLVRVQRPWD
jgi:hypothetical protein